MYDKIVIKLAGGKYVYTFENGMQVITRHGETWRNETGDGFILAMAQRIQVLEFKLENDMEEAVNIIDDVVNKNPSSCDSRLIDFLEERGLR